MSVREATQARKAEATRAQIVCWKVISIFCKIGGLNLWTLSTSDEPSVHRSPIRKFAICIYRIILTGIVCLQCCSRIFSAVRRFPSHPSPSHIFLLVYDVFTSASFAESLNVLCRFEKTLREMLLSRGDARHLCVRRIVVWAICAAAFSAVLLQNAQFQRSQIFTWSRSPNSFLAWIIEVGSATRFLVWQLQCIVFLFFLLVPQIIRCRLRELERIIDAADQTGCQSILEERAAIRKLTRNFNRHFGRLLLFFYVKTFAAIYIIVYVLLLARSPVSMVLSQAVNPLVLVVLFFDMAVTGTGIVDVNDSIGRAVLTVFRNRLSAVRLWRFARLMGYDKVQDSVRITDSFINCKSTLFGFCETLLTCIAVLLQFDYQLMASFDHSKKINGNSPRDANVASPT